MFYAKTPRLKPRVYCGSKMKTPGVNSWTQNRIAVPYLFKQKKKPVVYGDWKSFPKFLRLFSETECDKNHSQKKGKRDGKKNKLFGGRDGLRFAPRVHFVRDFTLQKIIKTNTTEYGEKLLVDSK